MEKGISKLANKRMFTMKIVDSDQFLNMSIEAQCAYFQLCMRSDDDGYLRSWKRTIRIIDAKEEFVSELISNGYLEKNLKMYINYHCSKKQQDMEKEINKGTLKNIKNGEKRCLKETIIFVKCVENQTPILHIIK